MLFATEAFKSFNAVIQAKSVHSNRHAPSQDIARAFAQGNQIRHLMSNGLFLLSRAQELRVSDGLAAEEAEKTVKVIAETVRADWVRIGPGPAGLVARPSTVTSYLGLGVTAQRHCA